MSADAHDDEFTAFVDAHGPALLRHAYLLSGTRSDAEELVQEALERVYLHWPRIAASGSPLAYTKAAIAKRNISRWRSLTRRRAYEQRAGLDRALWSARTGEEVDGIADRDALWDLLATIPPRQRAVIVLRHYEQLTEAEIAEVLSISAGTVKSTLSRGLAALRVTAMRELSEEARR